VNDIKINKTNQYVFYSYLIKNYKVYILGDLDTLMYDLF